ncbi:MAG: hypothetical protein AB7W59_14170 [Acidimicrobiia bacterium]
MTIPTRSVVAAGAVVAAVLTVPAAVSSAVSDASDRVSVAVIRPAVHTPEWVSDPLPVWPLETAVEAPPVTVWNAPIPTWSVPDLSTSNNRDEGVRRPVLTGSGRAQPLD